MKLTDLPKVVRRRWPAILACGLLSGAATFIVTPSGGVPTPKGTGYSASVILTPVLNAASAANPALQPSVSLVAALATRKDVAGIAAENLDLGKDAEELARSVSAEADVKVGVVTISANASDPDLAGKVAEAFAAATIEFMSQDGRTATADEIASIQLDASQSKARISKAGTALRGAAQAEQDAEVNRYQSLYTRLHDLTDTLNASATLKVIGAPAVSAADEGPTISAPRSHLGRSALGGLLGLALGVGVAAALHGLDRRLRERPAVEGAYGLPVLAEIPRLSRRARRQPVVFLDRPHTPAAVAYRALRSALMLGRLVVVSDRGGLPGTVPHPRRQAPQLVLVTSAAGGGGRSAVTANLAAALAEANGSVLVIDCNTHDPAVHRHLGAPLGVGLSELLDPDSDTDLEAATQATKVPGVRVVSAGTAARHPAAMLLGMAAVLQQARSRAEVILLDGPPLLGDNDAVDLLELADAVLVSCRAGTSTADQAQHVRHLIGSAGVPVLGVALISDRATGQLLLPSRGTPAAAAPAQPAGAASSPVPPAGGSGG